MVATESTAPNSLASHVAEAAVGVAVGQFSPGADAAANLAAMRTLTTLARDRGAQLVVFPEYSSFFEPVMGPAFVAASQPLDGVFAQALGALAAELKMFIVAGLGESIPEEARVFNTVAAFSPDGRLVAKYRKLHLYDAFGAEESRWVVPGPLEEPETFTVGGLTVALQTCYDVRFPEVTRRLADAGAELVVMPAQWARGSLKEHHWRTLVTARALENTLYLAAADHAPPSGVGASMVVDPMGVELVTVGEQTDVAVAWLTPERVASVRRVNPALTLRRFRTLPR